MELNERTAKLEEKVNNIESRMDKQDRLIESVHEIASSQRNMEKTLEKVSDKVENIGNKVVELEYEPKKEKSQKWDKATWIIIAGVVGFTLNYFLGVLFK